VRRWKLLCLVGCLLCACAGAPTATAEPTAALIPETAAPDASDWVLLDYAPAPADNPLKGFMPFYDAYGSADAPMANDFPHSMEWFYIPLRNVMNGPDSFMFETGMEPQLQSIASRGHQAAMRIYLDYPSKPSGIPQFLLDDGLLVHPYTFFGNSLKSTDSISPDYDDPRLIAALESFIAEFGRRYDGDPRIGFITLGLIGFWGEWHTWPMDGFTQETNVLKALPDPDEENWMPSDETQARILTAYDNAFNATRLLVRYPMVRPSSQSAGPGRYVEYGTSTMNIGYHDDSFAYNTLYGEDWYFMGRLAWTGGIDKWKTEPIGGELRPEIQISVWIEPPPRNDIEDFSAVVDGTHASWLIAHDLFTVRSITSDTAVYQEALAGAQRMGYEYYIHAVKLPSISTGDSLQLMLRIENTGAAPFYYDWPLELGVVDSTGNLIKVYPTEWTLTGLLPASGGEIRYAEWTYRNARHSLSSGTYTLVMHVVNPLSNGKALRFANTGQDATVPGWLTLGTFDVR
jgi:hypothetical protein